MDAHTCTPALTVSVRLLSIFVKGMNTKPITCKTAKENDQMRSVRNRIKG